MDEGIRFDLQYETMPWHKVDAVAFDIGNVLVYYPPDRLAARLFPEDAREREHMRARVFDSPFWREVDRGTLTFEQAAARLFEQTGGAYPLEDYVRAFRSGLTLDEPVEEGWRAAARCRRAGKRIYLLSNYSREGYGAVRARFADRFAAFDGACISAEHLLLKPERAIYETLLREYGLTPGRTLFIDDMLANVEGALRAGINGFHMDAPGKMDRFFL